MSLVPSTGKSIAQVSKDALANLAALSDDETSLLEGTYHIEHGYSYTDVIQRLQIWTVEHEVSSGRLDYKLRETSQLRNQVLSHLSTLSELGAQDQPSESSASLEVQDDHIDRSDNIVAIDNAVGVVTSRESPLSDDLSEDSASSGIDTSFTPESLPDSPLSRAHDAVTLLLQLGPSLLDPTPHNRFELPDHSNAAQYDIHHVRASFPKADAGLVESLGRANWERRQLLRKLRAAHEEDPYRVQRYNPAEPILKSTAPDLISSAFAINDSDSSDGGDETSGNIDLGNNDDVSDGHAFRRASGERSLTTDNGSDFHFSIDEIQSTAFTEPSKSFMPTGQMTPIEITRYRMPQPPSPNENLSGKTFVCPFCAHVISDMKSAPAWKKHVFEDLEPYMCTYKDCILSSKTYGSRKSWWDHERERHRTEHTWVCSPCELKQSDSVFDTPGSFDDHVRQDHPVKLTNTQLQSIREMCRRDSKLHSPSTKCPLCCDTIKSEGRPGSNAFERSIRKHISDHLEQLAYFVACPAGQMQQDDSELQDDSDSEDGLRTEIESVVSRGTRLSKKQVQLENVKSFIADQRRAAEDPNSQTKGPLAEADKPTTAAQESHDKSLPVTSRSAEPTFPLLVLMHPPNEHFYAREKLLVAANKVLCSPGSICIFHGVGGVGKTLAAVEYAYTYKDEYDAIFWLQADTTPGLADSYIQMAVALAIVNGTEDHNHIIDKGRNWLQETERRWLLVFDNALKWSEVARYMPNMLQRTNGSVLFTTQTPDNFLPNAKNVTRLQLEALKQQAGADMLLRYLGRDVRTDPERQLAKEISAFVGGLPVAIGQVAGYVSFSQGTLEELIEIFQQWRRRAGVATDENDDLPVAFREAAFSYDETLAMVWAVTLRELTEDARNVLNILAYLDCASVPRDMLWRVHEDDSLQFIDKREKIRMRKVNESLTKRRLVAVDADHCYSVHRSLQRGVREKLSENKAKQQTVFDQAVGLVREVFPRSNPLQQPTPEKWSERQKLLPHLHALHDVYQASKPHLKGSLDFAQLLLDAGMDQFEAGMYKEALLLLHTAEEVLDASPEDNSMLKADIHAMIAIMYDTTGIEKRRELFTRRVAALKIREKNFEQAKSPNRQDEILLYNSWMEYAISLLHYHRYEEAEPIVDKCLLKFKEWDTEENIPFEYSKYYNKIAIVRMYQGRFDEAIDLAAHSVQLMERTGYGIFTTRFKYDMACIVLQSGDLDRARQLHEEIYDMRIGMVGMTNELTLHSQYAIGAIYELKGDFDKAETWLRKALDQRRSVTSWPDEAFSRAQFHLSQVLLARGRLEDLETANALRDKALIILHRLLPLDMPPELEDVTDEAILFDHMLPVSPGGPRFTGVGLLQYFLPKND